VRNRCARGKEKEKKRCQEEKKRCQDPFFGQKTTDVFDALNRKTQTIDPRGGITTTVYDSVGNQVNVIDGVGKRAVSPIHLSFILLKFSSFGNRDGLIAISGK
jgi:hypothetical protein